MKPYAPIFGTGSPYKENSTVAILLTENHYRFKKDRF